MLHDKVLWYVATCWDHYRCADKDEVKRIIREVVDENPQKTLHGGIINGVFRFRKDKKIHRC